MLTQDPPLKHEIVSDLIGL